MAQMVIGHVFPLPANRDELPEGMPIYRDIPSTDEEFDFIDHLDLREFSRLVRERMKERRVTQNEEKCKAVCDLPRR